MFDKPITTDSSRSRRLAATAAVVALALTSAGCGGADGSAAATKPDPMVAWAGEICSAVSENTESVDPPALDQADPAATIDTFEKMFGRMAHLLDRQQEAVNAVGNPPRKALAAPYQKSLQRLEQAHAVVDKAQAAMSRATAANPAQLVAALKTAGSLQVAGKAYPGYVADLVSLDPAFGQAVQSAGACDKIPGQ